MSILKPQVTPQQYAHVPPVAVEDPQYTVAHNFGKHHDAHTPPVAVEETKTFIDTETGELMTVVTPSYSNTVAGELLPASNEEHLPAVQDASNLPAVAISSHKGISLDEYERAGFGGLKLGVRSYRLISLKNEGVFEDMDGTNYGKTFRCRYLESKVKFTLNSEKFDAVKKEKLTDVWFSYDGMTTTNGEQIRDLITKLEADGWQVSFKEYLDAKVELLAPGEEYDEELAVLSVSPQSVQKLAGCLERACRKFKIRPSELAEKVPDLILTVSVGEKVVKTKSPFYPWSFSFSAE